MKGTYRALVLAGMTAIAAIALVGCEKEDVLATVNDDVITRAEWSRRCETAMENYLSFAQMRQRIGRPILPVGYYCLEQLIGERIVAQLAKKEGVSATDEEVNDLLERLIRQQPQYLDQQKAAGRSRAAVKEALKNDINEFKLRTKGVEVSMKEVEDYIRLHPEDFEEPARVRGKVIAVTTEAAKKAVDKELAGGVNFQIVATNMSEDPSRERGGAFGPVPIQSLSVDIQPIIEQTRVFGTTPWIRQGNAWLKFYIDEKTEKRYKAPDEDVKWGLRRRLMLEKAAALNDYAATLTDAVNSAKVKINESWLEGLWKSEKTQRLEMIKQREKREKEAEATTGGTPKPPGAGASPLGGQ